MLSPAEMLIGGVVVILMFGTKKLPELGTGIGEAIANFKRAKDEVLNSTPLIENQKKTEVNKLAASPSSDPKLP